MTKERFLALLGNLKGDGIHFVTKPDGVISVVDDEGLKAHRKAARKRRHRMKNRSAGNAPNRAQTVPNSRTSKPADGSWNGITWQDAPGHDETAKKLNFYELIRGRLKGYEHCANFHGDALRAEFARINAGQKAKSQKAAAVRTAAAQARKQQAIP
jgi:hypothetical protein